MTECQEEWKKVTEGMPKPVSECWWAEVSKKYSEAGREAHDMKYLHAKFIELKHFSSQLTDVNAFVLAMFFQYFHYDTKDPDATSKNLESFEKFTKEAAISEESPLFSQIKHLLATSATYSTEEHKIEGAYGEEDVHYFLDLDMAWLGREPEAFRQSIEDAMREYSYLEPVACKRLIKRVLQSFVMIPNIYATKVFREKYEAQARMNIEQEVKRLSG